MRVYLSDTHCPFFNLATEDWLFHEKLHEEPVLFLWRNQKTVVIGRAQNPWVECNLSAMQDDQVILARRQSGGGTVFHDLGNTNFTFLAPKDLYDKDDNLKIMIQTLSSFGIDAEASPRNDILVNGKKVSGSAFRQSKERCFHHGTLLINADLEALTHYLNPNKKNMEAKGVKSVRSSVMNLSEQAPELTHESLCAALATHFGEFYNKPIEFIHLDKKEIEHEPRLKARYEELTDWQWRFGKTLKFEHTMDTCFNWGEVQVHLNCNHGRITECQIFTDALQPDFFKRIEKHLIDVRYDSQAIALALSLLELAPHQNELKDFSKWLTKEIN